MKKKLQGLIAGVLIGAMLTSGVVFAKQIPLLQYGIFLFELNIAQKKIYYKRFDEQFLFFYQQSAKISLPFCLFSTCIHPGKWIYYVPVTN